MPLGKFVIVHKTKGVYLGGFRWSKSGDPQDNAVAPIFACDDPAVLDTIGSDGTEQFVAVTEEGPPGFVAVGKVPGYGGKDRAAVKGQMGGDTES